MGLENLKKQIEDKARNDSSEIAAQAAREKAEIISKAEAEAKKILSLAKAEAEEAVSREMAEQLASVRLQASRTIAESKEAVINGVIQELALILSRTRKRKEEYKKLFSKLLAEALSELKADARVFVSKEDRELAKEILAGTPRAKLAEESIGASGGVLITSKDGRVRVDNTFESIVDSNKEKIRKLAYDSLFK